MLSRKITREQLYEQYTHAHAHSSNSPAVATAKLQACHGTILHFSNTSHFRLPKISEVVVRGGATVEKKICIFGKTSIQRPYTSAATTTSSLHRASHHLNVFLSSRHQRRADTMITLVTKKGVKTKNRNCPGLRHTTSTVSYISFLLVKEAFMEKMRHFNCCLFFLFQHKHILSVITATFPTQHLFRPPHKNKKEYPPMERKCG